MTNEFVYKNGNMGDLIAWVKSFNPTTSHRLKRSDDNKKRTLDQNAQSHVWYAEIANSLPDDNKQGWARYCKLHHGCPILCADDDDFREFYQLAIQPLEYEQRLKAMDYTPVTRLMKTKQFNLYFDALQDDFFNRGVRLEFLR